MQKIVPVPGGVKSYLASPDSVVTPETLRCPLCSDGHRLRIHGWYDRYALLPDPEGAHRIPIRRLLCPRHGQTVSLLPEFCLPRRQHGPGILGLFLQALVQGRSLLESLRKARPEAPGHSVAQHLLEGFLARAHVIQAYLARLQNRGVEVEPSALISRPALAPLVQGLLQGFPDVIPAFEHHNRQVHDRFRVGLA